MYNKSLDTASIDNMKKALAEVEVNESDRAKHYKSATPPEDMKNNRKGKGAQDMMQPADNAMANPAADETQVVNKDFTDMTKNVKVAKKRSTDKDTGDKKIVPSGTPMKDPAGPVKTAESVEKTKPQWIIDAYAEMNEDVKKVAGGVAKGKPGMKAFRAGESPFQKRIKKITGKDKLDSPHMQPQKEAKMDPVGKADADIDNDGDVDSSDKYLHNRRKAIKKAISKENVAAVKQNKPLQRKLDKLYGKKPQRNKSLEKKLDKLYGPKK